ICIYLLCALCKASPSHQSHCWIQATSKDESVIARSPAEGVAQIKSPERCVLSCLDLSFLWPLCLKISMPRSRSECCVFQPQEGDHRASFEWKYICSDERPKPRGQLCF
ncbi:mCG1042073, partial [Mus musculus]